MFVTKTTMPKMPSNETVLEIVREEHERGKQSVSRIRQEFERENILFLDQRKNRETIGDTTFFNIHSAFMARTYVDRPKGEFVSTKYSVESKSIVDNLNAVFNVDMDGEDIEKIRYKNNYDKYKYGAGFVVRTGWDGNSKKPTWEVADPRTVIPDPDGDYMSKEYSFIGFELHKRIQDMPEDWDTEPLVQKKILEDNPNDKTKRNAGLITSGDDENNPVYRVYYHFTTIDREKYMIVTGNDDTHVVHMMKYEPINDEQREDPSLIRFPITIDNWKPEKGNIFGHRLAVICTNTQTAITLLQNLRYKKTKAELYPMYLYNARHIKKREDLDFGFNKWIPANPLEGESLSNSVSPIQKDLRQDNSQVIEEMLQTNLTRSTGGMNGNIIQGSDPTRRETLGTNNLISENSDINLSLDDKIGSWFEKEFMELWLEGYLMNFKGGDKKLAKLETGMGAITVELTKDQFLSYYDISIRVTTKSDERRENEKKKIALSQTFAQLQTIERPKISQDIHAREVLKVNGISNEETTIFVPKSPDEVQAEQENILLNEAEIVDISADDDHLTHIIVHRGALPTAAKEVHIMAHLEAYKRSQKNTSPVVEADDQAKNIQQGQLGSQMSQAQSQLARDETQV